VLTGRPGPQPAPFTDDPARALASLDRLADLDVTWVLPGHGTPWSGGLPEAIRRIKAAAAANRAGRDGRG
jgi:glyoxylase-like metal-dependent hydrolase (beta-lactamase superfamily II)